MIALVINGESRQVPQAPLDGLLRHLGFGEVRRGLAVALNGQLVPRAQWGQQALADGDRLEIVRAVTGG